MQYSSWKRRGKLPSCTQSVLPGTTSRDPWFTGTPQSASEQTLVCLRKWMTCLIILVNASGRWRVKESFSSTMHFGETISNWSTLESWENPFLKRLPHYLCDCTVIEFQRKAWAGELMRSREESGLCPFEIHIFVRNQVAFM